MDALIAGTDAAGIWTIQSSVFPENAATLALHERAGFRVVGRRERIAQLDGVWRDTILLERRSSIRLTRHSMAGTRANVELSCYPSRGGKNDVKPIPDGYSSVTPYLAIDGAEQAIAFYVQAFGAKERVRMDGPEGKIAHAGDRSATPL